MRESKVFISKNIVLTNTIISGAIVTEDGRIKNIYSDEEFNIKFPNRDELEVIDVGNSHLLAGVVDSHVHINEPGRTEWEGFSSATKAAAAGGVTTIADMPLNSVPPTTSLNNLKCKLRAAVDKIHVDVAFWGGIVPGNENELIQMYNAGVFGFKCFMCPSGVDEFQSVNYGDIETAFKTLEGTDAVFAFHAEVDCSHISTNSDANPYKYDTFLKSRPASMETEAIKKIIDFSTRYDVKIHIVHLSSAESLPIIEEAKKRSDKITVETCHHYLNLAAEEISDKATQFKCCPPIRNKDNKEMLWDAVKCSTLDMVVSDHSPSTPDLKFLHPLDDNFGNFMMAWGGIASLQFGLSLFWTAAQERGFSILDINRYLSRPTASLIGLHNVKGCLDIGYDADIVVFEPAATYEITEDIIFHKNKVTPYLGRVLHGKVLKTFVRGNLVYDHVHGFHKPDGKLISAADISQPSSSVA